MKSLSRVRLLATPWLLRPWDFPGKSTGVGCHRLLRDTPKCFLNKEKRSLDVRILTPVRTLHAFLYRRKTCATNARTALRGDWPSIRLTLQQDHYGTYSQVSKVKWCPKDLPGTRTKVRTTNQLCYEGREDSTCFLLPPYHIFLTLLFRTLLEM